MESILQLAVSHVQELRTFYHSAENASRQVQCLTYLDINFHPRPSPPWTEDLTGNTHLARLSYTQGRDHGSRQADPPPTEAHLRLPQTLTWLLLI